MMGLSLRLWTALALLALISQATQLTVHNSIDPPMCAVHCWEKSKYVSTCMDDRSCLCNEAVYQKAIFQCIYAQCDSTLFGSAFLLTIWQCDSSGVDLHMAVPPPMGHNELRKREADYVTGLNSTYGFVSAGGYSTRSTQIFPADSISSSPTQSVGSVGSYYASNTATVAEQPTPAIQSLASPGNITVYFATPTATAHITSPQGFGAAASISGPLIYTNIGFYSGSSLKGAILIVLAVLYTLF